ncbi:MAG: formyltransferase [Chitinophagaceae bacterium]|nr:formyltransferase [Chitinophagaceae bacterium]
MKKIFFLLNNFNEFTFSEYLNKYLRNLCSISFGDILPENTNEYDLIILWNYRKILKNIGEKKNIVVFHSTNLPEGRGWAPIFYTVFNKNKYFHITGILADNEVDSGDIIIQAKFEIKPEYTAKYLRIWDEEICIILIKRILEHFQSNKLTGKQQTGISSYHPKRIVQDNEINVDCIFKDQIPLLRACENKFPAFFIFDKVKYIINIEPEVKPAFPEDLEITFYN